MGFVSEQRENSTGKDRRFRYWQLGVDFKKVILEDSDS